MKAIVVVDRNWGIGKEGKLLCHLPGDLKYFKEKTLGKTVLMGRKTLESLPGARPLPDRETVVLSKSLKKEDGYKIAHSVDEVLEMCKDKDVFVCGGQEVYKQMIDYCDTFYVTRIDNEFDADAYFPNIENEADIELVKRGEPVSENGYEYRFLEYERKK